MSDIQIIEGDCLEVMKTFKDNQFDLVLTDPPYGIGMANNPFRQSFDKSNWDDSIPSSDVFGEIFRVSRNQIIWGGNYYPILWIKPCRGFLHWNKMNHHENRCDGELAWTSIDMCSRHIDYMWDGNRYGFPEKIQGVGKPSIRVHPTQKPVPIMSWCLSMLPFVRTVLDPFAGSGTTGVACNIIGLECTLIEISEEYCEIARKRVQEEKDKMALFNERM